MRYEVLCNPIYCEKAVDILCVNKMLVDTNKRGAKTNKRTRLQGLCKKNGYLNDFFTAVNCLFFTLLLLCLIPCSYTDFDLWL